MAALSRSMLTFRNICYFRPSKVLGTCLIRDFTQNSVSVKKCQLLQCQYLLNCSTNNIIQSRRISSDQVTHGGIHDSKGEEKKSESDGAKKWQKIGFGIFALSMAGFAGLVVYVYALPIVDPEGNVVPDEFSHLPALEQYYRRLLNNLKRQKQEIEEPSRTKLLPDPVQYPYIQPPYTLVIEMTGVLVHPDWTYSTGWRFKKRPGIDYFLQQVAPPYFEVVVYTAETGLTADPLLTTLDPNNYITYRLYRDATRYTNQHHVKDLSCLNRDLSRVIMIDWNPDSYQLNPRNAFRLKKWSGEDADRTLFDLASFLRTIVQTGVDDVREVLDHYSQFDDPMEAFKENQRKLQEEHERLAKTKQEQELKKPSLGLGGIFGRK